MFDNIFNNWSIVQLLKYFAHIDNGIESMKDLITLHSCELNEFSFSFGEKIRVKAFLLSSKTGILISSKCN